MWFKIIAECKEHVFLERFAVQNAQNLYLNDTQSKTGRGRHWAGLPLLGFSWQVDFSLASSTKLSIIDKVHVHEHKTQIRDTLAAIWLFNWNKPQMSQTTCLNKRSPEDAAWKIKFFCTCLIFLRNKEHTKRAWSSRCCGLVFAHCVVVLRAPSLSVTWVTVTGHPHLSLSLSLSQLWTNVFHARTSQFAKH